ncbi:GTP-binding protein Rheb-like [Halichondria panicea]|uniref:GTP-binding protein Rheb-like n=1 Tax=Halichondria panicea TaxID=6063 RepID=UPI00312B711F
MPAKQRKIAVMGFMAVGKSSLVIQFVENQFVDSYEPTIENTFEKVVHYRGQEYLTQLVDTAGQDEYFLMPQTYTVGIHGYILVYSVTSMKSYEVLKVIYDKLLDQMGTNKAPIVLVGNKKDLHMQRVISYDMGKKLANEWNSAFVESSAKQNEEVDTIFQRVLQEIEKQYGTQDETGCRLL